MADDEDNFIEIEDDEEEDGNKVWIFYIFNYFNIGWRDEYRPK